MCDCAYFVGRTEGLSKQHTDTTGDDTVLRVQC